MQGADLGEPDNHRRTGVTGLVVALRLYGVILGAVLACGVEIALFVGLGYWLDGKWNCTPWLTVSGAVLGLVVGVYHLAMAVRRVARGL